jgi:hypothetical protein
MRRIIALTVVSSMSLSATPLFAAPRARAGGQGQGASLAGTATNNSGQALANYTVQLRNLKTGQLAGTTTSAETGAFSFAGLEAGNFAIEVVNAAGQIIGTSASVAVTAGAAITGVAVSASAAAIAGAAGAAGAAAAAGAAGAAGAGLSTAAIVTITTVAASAGIAGAVAVANNTASPSR